MPTRILLIGSGAREHALARAISRSSMPHELYCYASQRNPGLLPLCSGYDIGDITHAASVADYARTQAIEFAIIGPEAPLAAGIVDALRLHGISSIGPSQKLAQIETSKGFARDLLSSHLPQALPRYKRFEGLNATVLPWLHELQDYVIKADGLASGKGVKVSGEHLHSLDEALTFCQAINGPFVVEEKLIGVEFSLISFSDGKHLIHCPIVQDHKRAGVNDTGPNTGGMGSYSMADHSLPFLSPHDVLCAQEINEATVNILGQHFSEPYQGFLYGGFMKTAEGIKLIEYNARLGDPEAMNILPLLNNDFIDLCQKLVAGKLHELRPDFLPLATVCKYLVPEGYPEASKSGYLQLTDQSHYHHLYYGGVEENEAGLKMLGSRAIAVLGMNERVSFAEAQAEGIIQHIKGPAYHRPDIGTAELINQRIRLSNRLCHTEYATL